MPSSDTPVACSIIFARPSTSTWPWSRSSAPCVPPKETAATASAGTLRKSSARSACRPPSGVRAPIATSIPSSSAERDAESQSMPRSICSCVASWRTGLNCSVRTSISTHTRPRLSSGSASSPAAKDSSPSIVPRSSAAVYSVRSDVLLRQGDPPVHVAANGLLVALREQRGELLLAFRLDQNDRSHASRSRRPRPRPRRAGATSVFQSRPSSVSPCSIPLTTLSRTPGIRSRTRSAFCHWDESPSVVILAKTTASAGARLADSGIWAGEPPQPDTSTATTSTATKARLRAMLITLSAATNET